MCTCESHAFCSFCQQSNQDMHLKTHLNYPTVFVHQTLETLPQLQEVRKSSLCRWKTFRIFFFNMYPTFFCLFSSFTYQSACVTGNTKTDVLDQNVSFKWDYLGTTTHVKIANVWKNHHNEWMKCFFGPTSKQFLG